MLRWTASTETRRGVSIVVRKDVRVNLCLVVLSPVMADASRGSSRLSQAMAILEQRLDPSTLAIVRAALDDSDRLAVIRDAFLEGRDVQAVQMIRDLDPIGIRKALGVASGHVILAGTVGQIWARPQLPFQATHLVVSPRCAAHFDIEDIRIGNRSQFVNSTGMAADLFAAVDVLHGQPDEHGFYTIKIGRRTEAWLPLRIDMPRTLVGEEFCVVVRNVDRDDAHEFNGALIGRTTAY